MTHVLKISNASLAYQEKIIFSELNLTLSPGKWVGLIGTSGVGKSSLLRFMAGLHQSSAHIAGNVSLSNASDATHQIAYMAQVDLLLPWLTVLENTLLTLKLRHHSKHKHIAKYQQAMALLADVGLKDSITLYPHQLSGGMRQRAALVRTLLEDKPIVLMDEPFSALDTITRYRLQDLAALLLKDKAVLFITHDPQEALRLSHEVYIMKGCPAQLKSIAQLNSPIPRTLTDAQLTKLQPLLFQELLD